MTTLVLIFFFVAATLVAYVIGYWGRTSATVTSSNHETVAKETACRAGKDITDRGGLLEDCAFSVSTFNCYEIVLFRLTYYLNVVAR